MCSEEGFDRRSEESAVRNFSAIAGSNSDGEASVKVGAGEVWRTIAPIIFILNGKHVTHFNVAPLGG